MEEGQLYAKATKMLGNCRLEVECFDGVKRLAKIRGSIRKKQWISVGDTVLVTLREYQDGKCDVIGKLNADEARLLRRSEAETTPDNTGAGQSYAFDTEDIDLEDI